jgi:SulP family sulfate permease
MMLTVGTALAAYSADTALTAMVTLTLLVGVFMFLLGVLKLGSVIRFVSKEVMSGFVLAIALLATACGR